MDQLRKNLRILDTLADDASASDDGGYINLDEGEEEEHKNAEDGGTNAKKGKLSKVKGVFSRSKDK